MKAQKPSGRKGIENEKSNKQTEGLIKNKNKIPQHKKAKSKKTDSTQSQYKLTLRKKRK